MIFSYRQRKDYAATINREDSDSTLEIILTNIRNIKYKEGQKLIHRVVDFIIIYQGEQKQVTLSTKGSHYNFNNGISIMVSSDDYKTSHHGRQVIVGYNLGANYSLNQVPQKIQVK